MALLSGCWQLRRRKRGAATNPNPNFESREEDGDVYGEIPDPPEEGQIERRNGIVLLGFLKKKHNGNGQRKSETAGHKRSHLAKQKNSASAKKVSFSWTHSVDGPCCSGNRHKDSKDSYDYIDADGGKDAVDGGATTNYSRTHEKQHRYDYPSFSASSTIPGSTRNAAGKGQQRLRQRERGSTADEPFYASASQTYSMGSEDPYSSIVSIGDRYNTSMGGGVGDSSSVYEPGYSRISRAPANTNRLAAVKRNSELDALYAKIRRKVFLGDPEQPGTSSQTMPQNGRIGSGGLPLSSLQQQEKDGDSGSGSVNSSQPSYRYLTVRESVDVVRERIRLREEQQQAQADEQDPGGGREDVAYYSTIGGGGTSASGNEYETVGDGSLIYAGGEDGEEASLRRRVPPPSAGGRPISFNGVSNAGPLSSSTDTLRILLLDTNAASSADQPRPPTSPIPRVQQLPSPPVAPPPPPLMQMIRRPVLFQNNLETSAPSTSATEHFYRRSAPSGTVPTTNSSSPPKKVVQHSGRKPFLNGSLSLFGGWPHHHHTRNGWTSSSVDKQPPLTGGMDKPPPPPPTSPPPKAVGDQQQQHQSRIPVLKQGNKQQQQQLRRSRTPSPALSDAATQTPRPKGQQQQSNKGGARGHHEKRGHDRKLPAQVGQDYVSTIGMGRAGQGEQRGWPLVRPMSTSSTATSFDEQLQEEMMRRPSPGPEK